MRPSARNSLDRSVSGASGRRHRRQLRPSVVVEVKFNEWTSDGRLRQPIFLGVRDDKAAREVVREAP